MSKLLRRAIFMLVVVVGLGSTVQAQYGYHPNVPHVDYVPHTTTHLDAYRHGNHYHYVPHTTTHLDPVYHGGSLPYSYGSNYLSYRSGYGSYNSLPYSTYRPGYSPSRLHTSTHLDLVPHGNHYHVVPHTTRGHRH